MEDLHFNCPALFLILPFTLLPSLSTSFSPCNFPAIFNFGDSNSDTGGISAAFGQAPPPYGETYFHQPSGRYSDGRLIIDFISTGLGLPYLSAYLDSVGSNYSHGANFATAGSTIRPQNTTMAQSGYSPISLDVQLVQYLDFRKRSQTFHRQGGGVFEKLLPKEDHFNQALYTFDIGQNDLTSESVCSRREGWVHNTGPLGCLPYVLDRFLITAAQIDKFGCATPFNDVAQFFNHQLKEAIYGLRRELPAASITYVDVYSVKHKLITQAKRFGTEIEFPASHLFLQNVKKDWMIVLLLLLVFSGFHSPLVACCGHGGKYNFNRFRKCGATITVRGKETLIADSCRDPSVRVNWDGAHYTEAANKWVSEQIINGSYSDPPIALCMSCNRIEH
ncbi:hypothetical protein SAY87_001714 [Trapa incisa]|uniref:GDSL esterase/lipase n=1 Tax=Trapa incisa TaxID=236973 RepID=A0AAN7JVR1_9MYRT|nr:hypothetical protein SAY87_001714 [Trapa incisa]